MFGGGTVNPVIDRALPGAVVAGSTIYRSMRHNMNTSVTRHTPIYLECEWVDSNDAARAYFGNFIESLDFVLPTKGACEVNLTCHPNDWDDLAAANPTLYTAPTKGQSLVVANSPFYINDTALIIEDAKLSCRNVQRYREPTAGVNGRHGAVTIDKQAMLEGFFYFADNALSIGELVDS